MIPQKLTLENFMCYGPQPTTLDLNGIHLACLAGENGHGKSAIIDAITWALWGKARSRRDDELIHLGQEQMSVGLDFLLGDEQYRVLRQRSSTGRGNSALELQIVNNGQARPLTGNTLRETQQAIIDTICMDYDTFINSALLLQGRADEFTNQPPGERKRILGEILGLSLWETWEQRAKQRSRAAELRLGQVQAAAAQIEEELDKKFDYQEEFNLAQTSVGRLAAELQEQTKQLRAVQDKAAEAGLKKQALTDVRLELTNRQRELQTLNDRIASVDPEAAEKISRELQVVMEQLASAGDAEAEKLASAEDHEAEKEPYQKQREVLASEEAGLQATNKQLKADMDALAEEIELLKRAEAQCPLCDSELTEEHRHQILADKQAEGKAKATSYRDNKTRISEIEQKELPQVRQMLSNIDRELAEAKRLRERDLAEAKRLRERELTLSQEIARLKSEGERLAEWEEQAIALDQTLEQLTDRKDLLEEEFRSLEEITAVRAGLEMKVRQLEEQASHAKMRLGAVQQKLDHCTYLEGEKEKRQEEHDEAGREKAIFDELRLAFGKRGIQAMIIETVLPEIEEQANQLLEQMTDGRMHLSFESQRETKKGTLMETLDIEVSDELGSRNYDLFSGGEAFRINFAIRIAISKLLANRAGAQLRTLIIDEGFGSQDGHGRDRLVEAINSVRDDFALILVVTHIEELKGAFGNRIEVVKGPAGSMISVN